jgi:hypothetical protein
MRRHSFTSDSARLALGVAGIVGFVALALCSDANVVTRFHTAKRSRDRIIAPGNAKTRSRRTIRCLPDKPHTQPRMLRVTIRIYSDVVPSAIWFPQSDGYLRRRTGELTRARGRRR